jgi:hypothetical protein
MDDLALAVALGGEGLKGCVRVGRLSNVIVERDGDRYVAGFLFACEEVPERQK